MWVLWCRVCCGVVVWGAPARGGGWVVGGGGGGGVGGGGVAAVVVRGGWGVCGGGGCVCGWGGCGGGGGGGVGVWVGVCVGGCVRVCACLCVCVCAWERAGLTCPVPSVVEVHSEGTRLVLGLPGRGGAVLIVGVGVVVVHVLPRQHGGARRAAHGRGHKGVGEGGTAVLHDLPGLVHHLQRT